MPWVRPWEPVRLFSVASSRGGLSLKALANCLQTRRRSPMRNDGSREEVDGRSSVGEQDTGWRVELRIMALYPSRTLENAEDELSTDLLTIR